MNLFNSIFSNTGTVTQPASQSAPVAINQEQEKVLATDWGFDEAGMHRGHPESLRSLLRQIREGKVKEGILNLDAREKHRDEIRNKISEEEKSRLEALNDRKHIQETRLPSKEKELKEEENRLLNLRADIAQRKVQSEYVGARFWLYTFLAIFTGLFLIIFYASAVNSAFMRDTGQLVERATEDNIGMLLNSILDFEAVLGLSKKQLVLLLSSSLFFGFGVVPHVILMGKNKYKILVFILALIAVLLIDAAIAYKIDKSLHDIRIMMGLEDADWVWYKSINFYLVLAFGFGGYMTWSLFFEAAVKEHLKKDTDARGRFLIKGMEADIKQIRAAIDEIKKEASDMLKKIEALELNIKKLGEDLNKAIISREDLMHVLESFYGGWLRYLNGRQQPEDSIQKCSIVFEDYRNQLIQELNQNHQN